MKDPSVAARAQHFGVRAVPAVAVSGPPAACCAGAAPMRLRSAQPGSGNRCRNQSRHAGHQGAKPGVTVADLKKHGAAALTDAQLKALVVGKSIWLRKTVTGE